MLVVLFPDVGRGSEPQFPVSHVIPGGKPDSLQCTVFSKLNEMLNTL
jgi:hypothetical protein